MSIKDVTDAINAQLSANLTALGITALPTFGFGLADLRLEQDAPRIVWVPRGGKIDSEIVPAADNAIQFGINPPYGDYPDPRPLFTGHPRVEAHVWGLRANAGTDLDTSKDYAAATGLAMHLIAAMQEAGFGALLPTSDAWPDSQGEASRRGIEYVVTFELKLPWVDESATLAPITTLEVVEGTGH